MKKLIGSALLASAIAAGALVTTTAPASAYTVCNGRECWHSDTRLPAAKGAHFMYHKDDWYAAHAKAYRWHEAHDGRGYWRGGVWIGL